MDSRRTLTQLLTVDLKQVNFYEAKKGAILGNHYHKETAEYFYITKGTAIAQIGESSYFVNRGSLFCVLPLERHTIECLSDISMMTFLTKAYTKENPDIFK